MDTADRIGLLPGFGWMAGHNFWVTLVICLILTPVGHYVVGLVGESRLVPLSPDWQFVSFFPGDLFLGASAAAMLSQASSLDDGSHWYNGMAWQLSLLGLGTIVAVLMTYGEWRSGVYPTRAIFSPTKLYHNGLLYIGYGYVIVATLVGLVAGSPSMGWLQWLLTLAPGAVWLALVVKDSTLSPERAREKAKFAHVDDWSPIWVLP